MVAPSHLVAFARRLLVVCLLLGFVLPAAPVAAAAPEEPSAVAPDAGVGGLPRQEPAPVEPVEPPDLPPDLPA